MKTPKNETTVLAYVFEGVVCYVITRNIIGKYTLYKIIGDDYQRIKVAESPMEFDKLVEKDRSK